MDARLLLPRPVRRLPADLAAALLLTLATDVVALAPVISETPVRAALSLPFVLFVPGYVFIAALFPEEGEGPAVDADPDVEREGIDGIERVALSFGTSIALVPLIGLGLNFTPWGIRLVPILVSLTAFTLVATAVAAQRRWRLPPDERFAVPYREWIASARTELFEPETRTDAALNVVLALSVVLAVSSVGYAIFVPKQGEQFSELFLLTEGEDGELVADDYPTEYQVGESRPLVVGIGNKEGREVSYTLVVELQRVEFTANNSTRVLEERELQRFSPTVGANETWMQPHEVQPTLTGERLRLAYLLYVDEAPAEPSVANAYREVHLWVNVTSGQNPRLN